MGLVVHSLPTCSAQALWALHCDDSVNVTDVPLRIILALSLPISEVLGAEQNDAPDACSALLLSGTERASPLPFQGPF